MQAIYLLNFVCAMQFDSIPNCSYYGEASTSIDYKFTSNITLLNAKIKRKSFAEMQFFKIKIDSLSLYRKW